jgi:TetR/AcrR family transcriptional regulator, hemagglutinin/protease regulatory protein
MTKARQRARAPQMPPEERRQQLLSAGVACIAAKGIGATKHADLARACKVSVPAVFTYFPNRETLVTSILSEVGEKLLQHVIQPAQALPDPGQRLTATAPLFNEYAAQQPDYVKVWLMWSMHFSPDVRAQYQKFETRVIDALGKMIVEGTGSDGPEEDIQDRARMILASSAFLAKMVFDGVSEKRRNAFVEHVLEPLATTV